MNSGGRVSETPILLTGFSLRPHHTKEGLKLLFHSLPTSIKTRLSNTMFSEKALYLGVCTVTKLRL